MSQQTRRAPGRPKKASAEAVVDAPEPQVKAKKKAPILRKEVELEHTMWEIPKNGGIAFMIQQRGITVFDEKKALELHLFSGDVKKYGLTKALNRQKT